MSNNTIFVNIAISVDDKQASAVGAFEKLNVLRANDSLTETFSALATNNRTNGHWSAFYVTDYYNGAVRVC